MIWKILLGLGLCGIFAGAILIFLTLRTFYGAAFQSNEEDVAFIGFLGSVALLLFSIFIAFISVVFVLRNSKKEFDASQSK